MSDLALGGERIELSELLELAMETALHGMHISCPAVVVSYDRAAGTVEVSLPVDRLVPDSAGNLVAEPMPNLKDVPIAWMRCRAFAITFPLAAGDTGQLVICERSISAWRAGTGGHPGDVGMHSLDGSVFYPGLMDDGHMPAAADASNMIIGSETDGKGRIEILPAGGHLGAGASKKIARDTDSVDLGTWAFVPGTGGASLTFTPPGGAPQAITTAVQLSGKISGGSATWKAID